MAERHLLVVDDERLVRWSLAERFRADGFEVMEAGSVEAAIEQLGKSPDAVILDFRLPDGDGVSLLKRIRQNDPDLPVIMLDGPQGRRDDRLGDEGGRVRLRHQAVRRERRGDAAVTRARRHAFHARVQAAQGRSGVAVQLRLDDRRLGAHAPRQGAGAQGGREPGVDRVGHGGERHGQRSAREGHSLQQPSRRPRLHEHYLLGDARNAARIGTLRSRARRVHGRAPAEARPVRAGRRGHDLPRRDRGDGADPPGQAPARPRGQGLSQARRRVGHQSGRPRHRRHATEISRSTSAKASSARIWTIA